jgi:hypothetical protein
MPSRGAFSLSLIKGSLGHVLGNSLLSDLDPSLNSPPWMRGAPQSVLPSSHNCRLYQSLGLSLQRHPDDRPSRALPLPVHASNLKRGGRRPCSRRIPFNCHSKPLV